MELTGLKKTNIEVKKSVTILIHYLQNPMVHQVKGTRTLNSPVQVWIGRKGDSKCWQMKTDTGTIEEGPDCNDQKNYICEMPASVTSTVCYEYPSSNSSVPITVNCTFPENLCFKYDNTTASGEQITIQGCISADQCQQLEDQHLHCCEGHLCNSSKYDGHKKV
ncbi:unnamed protein product [Porites lobata]|uniref:Uncharacterized protein n=1 Tax=Porites lobata TaxID=104759 RepID=A0ABN8RG50_9CNID|nr:unnamed protein product [Porites lobata]